MSTPRNAFEQAGKAVGGFNALALRLGLSRQAVYKWRENGVPPERCTQIEALSGVPRHELRPDIFGDAPIKRRGRSEIAA